MYVRTRYVRMQSKSVDIKQRNLLSAMPDADSQDMGSMQFIRGIAYYFCKPSQAKPFKTNTAASATW